MAKAYYPCYTCGASIRIDGRNRKDADRLADVATLRSSPAKAGFFVACIDNLIVIVKNIDFINSLT